MKDTADSQINVHRLGLTDAERVNIFLRWLYLVQACFPRPVAEEKIRARLHLEIEELRGP